MKSELLFAGALPLALGNVNGEADQPEIKTQSPTQRVVNGGQIFAVPDVDNGVVIVKLLFEGREIVVPLAPSESVRLYTQLHSAAAYVRKHKGAKKPK